MEALKAKLAEMKLEMSTGLFHVLSHHGDTRKGVYKYLYGQVVYGGKLAPPGSTVVFPKEVRDAVRERFPGGEEEGKYDDQYVSDGIKVDLKTMSEMVWRAPPKSCSRCAGAASGAGAGTGQKSKRFKPY